jgi:hypothetical protein
MHNPTRRREHGQAIALLAIALAAVVAGVGIVVDGGYAFAQRRVSQNAADFAAMAGTRIIGQKHTGRPAGTGTAANVTAAIQSALAANEAVLEDAQYVDEAGLPLGSVVGASQIPPDAFGVVVSARTDWHPFLLGILGITDWAATSEATAKTTGEANGGGVMPVGIQDTVYNDLDTCDLTSLVPCVEQSLTSGRLNIPGGFGWLSFGSDGPGQRCDWSNSLGMMLGSDYCQQNNPYLQSQIGPPAIDHGCCTAVGQPGSVDRIGSLTGNTWGDLSFYIDERMPVWVPIWDYADDTGAGGYYHIVGFGAIVFADSGDGNGNHAKWLKGAAIPNACAPGTEIPGQDFCTTPGGPFIVDATGQVELIR